MTSVKVGGERPCFTWNAAQQPRRTVTSSGGTSARSEGRSGRYDSPWALVGTTGNQHSPRPGRMLVVEPAAHERLKRIEGSRGGVGSTSLSAGSISGAPPRNSSGSTPKESRARAGGEPSRDRLAPTHAEQRGCSAASPDLYFPVHRHGTYGQLGWGKRTLFHVKHSGGDSRNPNCHVIGLKVTTVSRPDSHPLSGYGDGAYREFRTSNVSDHHLIASATTESLAPSTQQCVSSPSCVLRHRQAWGGGKTKLLRRNGRTPSANSHRPQAHPDLFDRSAGRSDSVVEASSGRPDCPPCALALKRHSGPADSPEMASNSSTSYVAPHL